MLTRLLLVTSLLTAGCARERPLAPTEMTDLVRYMFEHWEDPEELGLAVDALAPWLHDNVDTEEADDGYRLDPLAEQDVAAVDHPDRNLNNLLGAAGAHPSPYALDEHATHMVLTDQLWSNPSQYKRYDRTVTEEDDDFLGGEGSIFTSNAIETSNFGVSIPYTLLKDYRWVESETGERAIVTRSWVEKKSCNEGGGNCLVQSFSVEVFLQVGKKTERLTASWSEVESGLPLPDDVLIAGLAKGLQNVFVATDEFLSER